MDSKKVETASPNVCKFFNFLETNTIKVLVSLAPNDEEAVVTETVGTTTTGCRDYVGLAGKWDETVCTAANKCDRCGKKYFITDTASGHTKLKKRTVNFGDYSFTQLYFTGWPDAHGEALPKNPNTNTVKYIIEQAAQQSNVLVHCLGGRGRTGTVISGVVHTWRKELWKDKSKADQGKDLVETVLRLRERRDNIVEHPVQLMMLGKILGLNDDSCSYTEV